MSQFQKPDVWVKGRRSWTLAIAAAVGAVLLLLAFGVGHGTASSKRITPTPMPTATPTPTTVRAVAIVNTVRLYDDDHVQWLSYYEKNQDLLGDPETGPKAIGGNPDCVTFKFYVVCHASDPVLGDGEWSYVPLALGYEALPEGVSVQLDAAVAPVPQAFIDSIKATGRDWIYWLGRPISTTLCSQAECMQVFERAVLRWPNRPDAGVSAIQRSTLGKGR